MSESVEGDPELPVKVVRDSTFARFVADKLIIADLGPDLEIACLQSGPVHTHLINHGTIEECESEYVVTEVARMRLSYATMVQTVMSFLHGGIQNDRLKGAAIVSQLNQWIEDYASENREDETDV